MAFEPRDGHVCFTRFRDLSQAWVSEGWHERCEMPADEEVRGVGWGAAQVAQWSPPPKSVQIAYHEAVKNHTRNFLAIVTPEELERKIVMGNVHEPVPSRPEWVRWYGILWPTGAR